MQAAFIAARSSRKAGALTAASMVEVGALFRQGHLVVADTPYAEAALRAAEERDRERRRLLMREEKDDYHRIMKEFRLSPSHNVIGTKPDGTPILRELTPFERQRVERKRLQQQASRAAKHRAPGDPW